MEFSDGIITAVSGGLYEVLCDDGLVRRCPARGLFRHENITPLVGDRVAIEFNGGGPPDSGGLSAETCKIGNIGTENCRTDSGITESGKAKKKRRADEIVDGLITEVKPRRSELLRPPVANLDLLYITVAAERPDPLTINIDKLTCVAEHNKIEPVIIITKRDLAPESADALAAIYNLAGFTVFTVSADETDDAEMGRLRKFIKTEGAGKISAFAGASGVGKSTLLGIICPELSPEVGELSRRIGRGRQTTRSVTLYTAEGGGFIADTPGFGMLDFIRFDFMSAGDLELEFREFAPYLGKCRYTDCSHTKEEGCMILEALGAGKIAPSRHESYSELLAELRAKNPWK